PREPEAAPRRHPALRRRAAGEHRAPQPGGGGASTRHPRPARGGPGVPYRGAPHLRGGRRGGLPEPGLGLDGAGAGGSASAFGVPSVTAPTLFPYGIYTIPEVSFVGRTEEELTVAQVPYEVGIANYREIARGGIIGDAIGRLKLLFHRETGAVLGVHIIGDGATELVHIGQAVIALGGTVRYFV